MVSLSGTGSLMDISDHLTSILDAVKNSKPISQRTVEVPVYYGSDYGPDLPRVAEHAGLSQDEVIKRHSRGDYLVYFIGFSIGFPYFGGMDSSIGMPRLDVPRKKVPKGSIGIAGNQTGIYPLSSPGGWNLIGRTELDIFNVSDPEQSVIKMGDKVRFIPMGEK